MQSTSYRLDIVESVGAASHRRLAAAAAVQKQRQPQPQPQPQICGPLFSLAVSVCVCIFVRCARSALVFASLPVSLCACVLS